MLCYFKVILSFIISSDVDVIVGFQKFVIKISKNTRNASTTNLHQTGQNTWILTYIAGFCTFCLASTQSWLVYNGLYAA